MLRPIVDQFKDWVANNRKWIAQKVAGAVEGLADALKKIDIKQVVEDFGSFTKHVINLAGVLGPIPTTIGAISLALGSSLLHALTGADPRPQGIDHLGLHGGEGDRYRPWLRR